MTFDSSAYALTPIAATDGPFVDFAPYVAAIDDDGVVAFQATLRDGQSGAFTGDGRSITQRAATTSAACPARLFSSHPDINRAGDLAVHATLGDGGEALLLLHADGRVEAVQGEGGIGPLGPTMNARGDVAVRGTSRDGRAWIRVWRDGRFHPIAEAGGALLGFEGLPVIDAAGHVAFRANLPGAGQGIFVHRDGRCVAVAATGDGFEDLGRFPMMNDHGVVAFAARRAPGESGIFTAGPDGLACVVDGRAGFESFRGVLVNNAGPVVFYGTPVGGRLGIHAGTDPRRHRLLGIGDALSGAAVVDLALNPVSVNERGQVALRVALDDGRQFILRADPVA